MRRVLGQGHQRPISRRIVTMPHEEKQETETFVHRVSQAAEVAITHSNLMRACRDLLFQVEARLTLELSRAKLKRPINDKQAIAFFESRLTEIIHTAIRQSPLPYARRGK